ncbi:MAG: four-carbon acid sugar kinase family protein [Actinomycetota bacterium]
MKNIIIIADDLTGACNASSCFSGFLPGIDVLTDSAYLSLSKQDNPLVISTNTRAVKAKEAYSKLYALGNMLIPLKGTIIKKIDTAYRGNVGPEIDAVLDSCSLDLCFVLNSIPSMGRITLGGNQIFGKKPLAEAGFLTDPLTNIKTSFAPELITKTKNQVSLIGLEEIRDTGDLHSLVEDRKNKGYRIMVFDSCTDEDIQRAVGRLWGRFNCFWAGSLGLLGALGKNRSPDRAFGNLSKTGKVLGFTASCHELTSRQLSEAQAEGKLKLVSLEVEKAAGHAGNSYIRALAERNRPFWGKLALFLKPGAGPANKPGLDKKILSAVSAAAGIFCKKFSPEKLVLIGGDTSYAVLDSLGVTKVKIEGQFEQAIDFGTIMDGRMAGCTMIIKGGSVGKRDSLVRMLTF